MALSLLGSSGGDKAFQFCRDIITYSPFYDSSTPSPSPVDIGFMKIPFIIIGQPNIYDIVLAIFELTCVLYLLNFARKQRKQVRIGLLEEAHSAQILIFPMYLYLIWLISIWCFIQGSIDILLPVYSHGRDNALVNTVVHAFAWGVMQALYFAILILFCCRGVGKRAAKTATYFFLVWAVITTVVTFTLIVSPPTAPLHVAIAVLWSSMALLMNLVIYLAPQKWLFRRPAANNYALFFVFAHTVSLAAYILAYFDLNLSYCAQHVSLRGFLAVFAPYMAYRAMLTDSAYWLGIADASLSSTDTDAPHDRDGIDAPLEGLHLEPGSARAMAREMDGGLRRVAHLNFAHLRLEKTHAGKSTAGKYVVLGAGSTSRVFKGRLRERPVAVKMVFCVDLEPSVITNFSREAALLSSLRHPNIVAVEGMCVNPPALCLVMELCAGSLMDLLQAQHTYSYTPPSLHTALSCNDLPAATAVVIARPAASDKTGRGARAEAGVGVSVGSVRMSSLTGESVAGSVGSVGLRDDPHSLACLGSGACTGGPVEAVAEDAGVLDGTPNGTDGSAPKEGERTSLLRLGSSPDACNYRTLTHSSSDLGARDSSLPVGSDLLQQAVLLSAAEHEQSLAALLVADNAVTTPTLLSSASSSNLLSELATSTSSDLNMLDMRGPSRGLSRGAPARATSEGGAEDVCEGVPAWLRRLGVRDRGIPWLARLRLMLECCAAVSFLHQQSPPIVHLDVKSQNFLLGLDGRLKLSDLELSRRVVVEDVDDGDFAEGPAFHAHAEGAGATAGAVARPNDGSTTASTSTAAAHVHVPVPAGVGGHGGYARLEDEEATDTFATHSASLPPRYPTSTNANDSTYANSNPASSLSSSSSSLFATSSTASLAPASHTHLSFSRASFTAPNTHATFSTPAFPSTTSFSSSSSSFPHNLSSLSLTPTALSELLFHLASNPAAFAPPARVALRSATGHTRVPDRVNWLAPELMQSRRYSHKADVYSLACVLWEIATGRVPFDELEQQIMTAIALPRSVSTYYRADQAATHAAHAPVPPHSLIKPTLSPATLASLRNAPRGHSLDTARMCMDALGPGALPPAAFTVRGARTSGSAAGVGAGMNVSVNRGSDATDASTTSDSGSQRAFPSATPSLTHTHTPTTIPTTAAPPSRPRSGSSSAAPHATHPGRTQQSRAQRQRMHMPSQQQTQALMRYLISVAHYRPPIPVDCPPGVAKAIASGFSSAPEERIEAFEMMALIQTDLEKLLQRHHE